MMIFASSDNLNIEKKPIRGTVKPLYNNLVVSKILFSFCSKGYNTPVATFDM